MAASQKWSAKSLAPRSPAHLTLRLWCGHARSGPQLRSAPEPAARQAGRRAGKQASRTAAANSSQQQSAAASSNQQQPATSQQAAASSKQPTTSSKQQSAISNQQSASSKHHPSSCNQQPAANCLLGLHSDITGGVGFLAMTPGLVQVADGPLALQAVLGQALRRRSNRPGESRSGMASRPCCIQAIKTARPIPA